MKSVFLCGSAPVFLYVLYMFLYQSPHLQWLSTNRSLVLHEIKTLAGAHRRSPSLSIILVYSNEMEDTKHLTHQDAFFCRSSGGAQTSSRQPDSPNTHNGHLGLQQCLTSCSWNSYQHLLGDVIKI